MKPVFAILLLLFSLLSNSQAQPFQIGSQNITLTDPSRSNRSIGCEVYYPATAAGSSTPVANGQFPVIVVGHGFSMGVGAYENWWTEFVPDGYIFVLPTTEVGPIPFPSHPDFGLDLAFAASEAQNWNTDQTSDFFGKVSNRTALMGHSMGGGCSFLAAENNSMIDCILGLAPAETNTSAITAAAGVTAPTMILWGTEDEVTPEADHALAIFNGLASNCKNYIRIDQGAHCFFANYNFFCATGEMNIGTLTREGQHQVSFDLARPFFDYFLKDDCDAYNELQSEISTNTNLGTNILSCPNNSPSIVENAGTLESDVQPNYQWYLNGTEISGANLQTYQYTSSGTYQVGTVNVGNCPVFSNEITVTVTGMEETSVSILSSNNERTIIRSDRDLGPVQIAWFDLRGKLLQTDEIQIARGYFNLEKPTRDGIKILRILSTESTHVFKIW